MGLWVFVIPDVSRHHGSYWVWYEFAFGGSGVTEYGIRVGVGLL